VIPTALTNDGYMFTHSTLDVALRDLLGK
jgi:NAD dependent epimerase/dehydratase family enzyme